MALETKRKRKVTTLERNAIFVSFYNDFYSDLTETIFFSTLNLGH